jgi:uncharacterized protein
MAQVRDEHEKPVEFLSNGSKIRGVLKLPKGDGPHPIVILGHGLGALKEWTLPEVADAIIECGIAGLWFDYRCWGDSEGEPREDGVHLNRLEDWRNAISFAISLPEVDSNRIGLWGTSLGGRDVLAVASMDTRVSAVVSQTPLVKWFPALSARMAGFGDDVERYHRELDEDRTNRCLGKPARYVPYVKATGDDAKAGYISQLSDAERRNYSGQLTLQSYQATIFADVIPLVEMIAPKPLLFILADEDFLPGQREAYEAAGSPKSLVTVRGHHFAPYTTSKPECIAAARDWFQRYLGTS